MSKIQHNIFWEVSTVEPAKHGILARLVSKLGHTKSIVHTYRMDLGVTVNEGDSNDAALESIMRQLKQISSTSQNRINAHNGISKTTFVRNDLV